MRIKNSQLPGVSRLAADYLEDYQAVSAFFGADYRQHDDFHERTDLVTSRDMPLSKLVPLLKEQNQRFGCGSGTLQNLNLLLENRACAVVTGQQTGLFGGPLFTLYKAFTTIKLADRLNRTCSGCFVPVFWLASDDHDFREANHIHILDKGNQPLRIGYEDHPVDAKIPMSEIQISDAIHETFEALDENTHPSDFKEGILNHLREAYAPGTPFSDAFGRWLTTLLQAFGLILVDASDARIKALGAEIFHKEIAQQSPSTAAALSAAEELRQQDYHVQVELNQEMLNLFYVDGERNSVEIVDGRYRVKNTEQTFETKDLEAQLKTHPERFSPNVLLRPLYQDALFPTISYIAGPGEIAYYAQMKGIYERFELPMPIIYPRKSMTLLEGKIEKVLDKYELGVPDFWGDIEALVNRVARAQLPETIEDRIARATQAIDQHLQDLQELVTEFEPTLTNAVENMKGKISGQVEGLEKKILQAYKKRNDVIRQQLYKAGHSLYPNHQLQERALNITPYLFKYGFDFIERLYEAVDISNFDHQIVRL